MNREQIEREIGLDLPDNFEKYSQDTQQLIVDYLKQLNSIERKAYNIGKKHLRSSFNVVKSNGFNEWKKKNNK
jgi:hypothetical protein